MTNEERRGAYLDAYMHAVAGMSMSMMGCREAEEGTTAEHIDRCAHELAMLAVQRTAGRPWKEF